jgi:hypothetical protein
MSYGNIKKSTAYDAKKKFEKLIKMNRANMSKDGTWITGNPQTGQQPCPRQQEDAGAGSKRTLRRCGWRRSGFPACLTATLLTVLYVASLNKGSMQSLATNPVI